MICLLDSFESLTDSSVILNQRISQMNCSSSSDTVLFQRHLVFGRYSNCLQKIKSVHCLLSVSFLRLLMSLHTSCDL